MVMTRKPTPKPEEPQTEDKSTTTAAQKEKEKPTGRPSKYTPELAKEICERLSEGEPLRVICRDGHMPAWRTVYDWMGRSEDLSASIARARDIGYDKLAEECLEIADTPQIGKRTVYSSGAEEKEDSMTVTEEDMLGHRKLQIETRLKLLAKFHPTKYGEKAIKAEADDPAKTNQEAKTVLREVLKSIELRRQTANG